MSSWAERNRDAVRAAWRRWYRANKDKKLEWQARRRAERRAWWVELKRGLRCVTCGEAASECLQFHHEDPRTKEITVAQAVADGWPKARVLGEIAKCRVLCANCHAKLHWELRYSKMWSG